MMRSLFSGVSGLKTHQQKMDVIGNNIANVNTTAFKSSSTQFQDIMYQTMSGASGPTTSKGGVNARQIGLGVTTAATKISITSSGAAQSTGDGLDVRLTDKNSTNFFIVNDGSKNVFTRSGSFYIDENGNLCMTSTGYTVMGWQPNADKTAIVRDTVSSLRIKNASNMTTDPESTSQANVTGIIDENDTNINSASGYVTSLTFYDNRGYAYTAKFAINKGLDGDDTKGYTIKLTSITSNSETDSNGNPVDVLERYINEQIADSNITNLSTAYSKADTGRTAITAASTEDVKKAAALEEVFGDADGKQYDTFKINSPDYTINPDGTITYKSGNNTYTSQKTIKEMFASDQFDTSTGSFKDVTFELVDNKKTTVNKSLKSVFSGLSSAMSNYYNATTKTSSSTGSTSSTTTYTLKNGFGLSDTDASKGTITLQYGQTNYNIDFNANNGTFSQIKGTAATAGTTVSGGDTVTLNMSALGNNFSDITIDFSSLLNYNNGGTSAASMDRGTVADASVGAGKKLGNMTGVSIDQTGCIYGSYDNGNTELLGQIAVAQFANASGLESLGDNCYGETLNSGEFDGIGRDISTDGSSMSTGQLEMSNVDL